jgi:hypothetical protein
MRRRLRSAISCSASAARKREAARADIGIIQLASTSSWVRVANVHALVPFLGWGRALSYLSVSKPDGNLTSASAPRRIMSSTRQFPTGSGQALVSRVRVYMASPDCRTVDLRPPSFHGAAFLFSAAPLPPIPVRARQAAVFILTQSQLSPERGTITNLHASEEHYCRIQRSRIRARHTSCARCVDLPREFGTGRLGRSGLLAGRPGGDEGNGGTRPRLGRQHGMDMKNAD